MVRIRRFGVALLLLLATTAGCDRDAPGPAGPAPTTAGTSGAAAATPGGLPSAATASTPAAPSAPPIVTGTSKPPGGSAVAAALPPCSELKPLIDEYLTGAKVTREAPGTVTTCFVIGAFRGTPVDAQLQYGHSTADKTVRKAAGTGCAAPVRPLELHYRLALGCDNPTATVHSGAALAQNGSFAAAILTGTGDPAGTVAVRAAVGDAARKLAADVLGQLG